MAEARCPSWSPDGAFWGPSWTPFGPSWACSDTLGPPIGRSGGPPGPSWTPLGHLGAIMGPLGPLLGSAEGAEALRFFSFFQVGGLGEALDLQPCTLATKC